jgi:hypothetical protein
LNRYNILGLHTWPNKSRLLTSLLPWHFASRLRDADLERQTWKSPATQTLLGCAINQLIKEDKLDAESARVPRAYPWLDKSTAQISLKLTVDEKSTLNAGLNYSDFFTNSIYTIGKTIITTPRSFVFGANIGGSSDATRIDNSDYTFSVADAFVKDRDYDPVNGRACEALAKYGFVLFNSNLHIRDRLESRLAQFELHPEAKQVVPDTLTTDITFVVVYSGNITPTWHLVTVSYNTGGSPLFNAARTRTDDVIISIGSNKDKVTTAQNIQKQFPDFLLLSLPRLRPINLINRHIEC